MGRYFASQVETRFENGTCYPPILVLFNQIENAVGRFLSSPAMSIKKRGPKICFHTKEEELIIDIMLQGWDFSSDFGALCCAGFFSLLFFFIYKKCVFVPWPCLKRCGYVFNCRANSKG